MEITVSVDQLTPIPEGTTCSECRDTELYGSFTPEPGVIDPKPYCEAHMPWQAKLMIWHILVELDEGE